MGRFAAELRGRRAVRRRLRAVRPMVQPGLWVAMTRDRAVRLPSPWPPGDSVGRRLLNAVVAVVLAPWSVAWVSARGRGAAPADGEREYRQLVVGAKDTILVAPGRHLLRLSDRKLADAEHVRARTAVADHLPSPSFEVRDDGRAILEEFVTGPLVAALPAAEQVVACQQVLAACRTIVAARAEGSARDLVAAAIARPESVADRVPRDLLDGIADLRAATGSPAFDGPLVPAHADLKPTNLVRRGDAVVAIDLEYASLQPFYFDTANLVTNMAAADLIGVAGIRDELAAVHDAAGVPAEREDLRRSLVAFAALRSHRYALRGIHLDDDAYARSLRWSWRLVRRTMREL